MNRIAARVRSFLGAFKRTARTVPALSRDPVDHVVLLDGTMSSLSPGCETNIGLIYKILRTAAETNQIGIHYESGIQWHDWSSTLSIIEGRGINRQIMRAYGYLASRYRPGDRIFLLGYSRGAYAVRSLAGVIERVGLLKHNEATERMIRNAYRYYQFPTSDETATEFRDQFCHTDTPIEMVGVFDTVKALGINAPFITKRSQIKHSFHDDQLGPSVRKGYHALALNETRVAFSPVLWRSTEDHAGHVEQVWFRGTHGDIGGQLTGYYDARPLSNIPLTWMLEKLEGSGIALPEDWRSGLPTDAEAPSIGAWFGWAKIFLLRRPRAVGQDPSEALHPTAENHSKISAELPLAEVTV